MRRGLENFVNACQQRALSERKSVEDTADLIQDSISGQSATSYSSALSNGDSSNVAEFSSFFEFDWDLDFVPDANGRVAGQF